MRHLVVPIVVVVGALLTACHGSDADGGSALHGQVVVSGDASDIHATLVGPTVRALPVSSDGTFAATGLPPGAYALDVVAASTRELSIRRDVALTTGQDVAIPPIALTALAYVHGTALLTGATQHEGSLVTASDGSATLTGVDGGFVFAVDCTATSLTVTRENRAPATTTLHDLGRGAMVEVGTLTLAPADEAMVTFTGTARVAGSNDAAGIEVRIEALGLSATTDADGVFVFPAVPAGAHQVVWSRGDAREELRSVLLGVGSARASSELGFTDLREIELAPRRQIAQSLRGRGPIARSASGRFVAEHRGVAEESATFWDTTTDQALLTLPIAASKGDATPAVTFTGETALVAQRNDFGTSLVSVDPATGTVQPILPQITTWVAMPALGINLYTGASGTEPLQLFAVPWDTHVPRALGAAATTKTANRTYTTRTTDTSGTTHIEWRDLGDGALRQQVDAGVAPGALRAVNSAESLLVLSVGDHYEAWTTTAVTVSVPLSCSQIAPSFDGKYVWCGSATAWTRYDAATWQAQGSVATGDSALPDPSNQFLLTTTLDTGGHVTLKRYGLADGAAETLAILDAGDWGKTVRSDGIWYLGRTSVFVPAGGGAAIVIADTVQQTLDGAGRLWYRNSANELHRFTVLGADELLDTGVLGYRLLADGDVVFESRQVGDRREGELVAVASGARLALGSEVEPPLFFSTTEFYLRRQNDLAPYVNGIYRGVLAP